MPSHSKQTVYESSNIRVTHTPCTKSKTLVVTFMTWHGSPSLDLPGWGESVITSSELGGLFFTCRSNDWWHYADIHEALQAAHDIAKTYCDVIAYGASMGAYAAIRFSGAIGADRVLAISPQFSTDPAKAPFETRWAAERASLDHTFDEILQPAARVTVVYDPASTLDRQHADAIEARIVANLVPLRNTGHAIPDTLNQMKLLKPLLLSFVDGSFCTSSFQRIFKENRSRSNEYLKHLARRGRSATWRIKILTLARAINPEDAGTLAFLGDEYLRLGRHEIALELFQHASAIQPNNAWIHSRISRVHETLAAQMIDRALESARLAVHHADYFPWFHHHLGEILERTGDLNGAKASYENALRIEPDNKSFQYHLARISEGRKL